MEQGQEWRRESERHEPADPAIGAKSQIIETALR